MFSYVEMCCFSVWSFVYYEAMLGLVANLFSLGLNNHLIIVVKSFMSSCVFIELSVANYSCISELKPSLAVVYDFLVFLNSSCKTSLRIFASMFTRVCSV